MPIPNDSEPSNFGSGLGPKSFMASGWDSASSCSSASLPSSVPYFWSSVPAAAVRRIGIGMIDEVATAEAAVGWDTE